MGVIPEFPKVDVEAIERASYWLLQGGSPRLEDMYRSLDQTRATVLSGQHGWSGESADRWRVVVEARRGDLDTAAAAYSLLGLTLRTLAGALQDAKSSYDTAYGRLVYMHPELRADRVHPRTVPTPDEQALVKPLHEAVDQAMAAIRRAVPKIVEAGELADKITANGSRSGLPGVPAGADRGKASLDLLTFLFGSLAEDRQRGLGFQDRVLRDFGMPENQRTLTDPGWVRGTRPDGLDGNRVVEVKRTPYQWNSTQIRQQMEYARKNGLEFRLVLPKGGRISAGLADAIERNPKANWYTAEGNGVYHNGKDGNYYKISEDGSMQRTDRTGGGSDDDNWTPPSPPAVSGRGGGEEAAQPVPNVPGGGYAPFGPVAPGGVPVPVIPGVGVPVPVIP